MLTTAMNRHACIFMLALIVAALPSGQARGEMEYVPPDIDRILTADNIDRLQAGEILRFSQKSIKIKGSTVGGGYAMGIIEREPEVVWAILTDFEKHPEYMPRLRAVHVGEKQGETLPIRHTIKVLTKKVSYNLIQTLDEQTHCLSWRIDPEKENDIRETVGSWQLRPYENGQCLAVYSVFVNSGHRVPNFIEHYFTRRDMPNVIQALKKRVESNGTYTKQR